MANIGLENRELIEKMISPFLLELGVHNINISEQIYRISIRLLSQHLKEHIDKYPIGSKSGGLDNYEPEVYKIYSWYAFILIDMTEYESEEHLFSKTDREFILNIAINYLNMFLEKDTGHKLSEESLLKIFLMGSNNRIDDEFAIGQNGLYLAFKTSKMLCETVKIKGK